MKKSNDIGYLQILVASGYLKERQKYYKERDEELSRKATVEWKKLHDGLSRRFDENSSS